MTDKKKLRELALKATWICHECAIDSGGKAIDGHVATFHPDDCSICKKYRAVTEPRDYRWPKAFSQSTEVGK
jgi:rubrerythrin